MRIDYHRTLIADTGRNTALMAALRRVIVPGQSIVADIGAGTGLIGFMAARLGAKSVTLYESEAVIQVAREIARANKLRNVHFVPMHSTAVENPEKADIIVSETLGNYAFEENMIQTLEDARRRFLKPGGVIIPGSVEQYIAPVVARHLSDELDAWRRVGASLRLELDMTPARTMSRNNIYVRRLNRADLFENGASGVVWDRVDFMKPNKPSRSGRAQWAMKKNITITGAALWWSANLADGVTLATGPEAVPTHWEQLYLPVLEPIDVKAGETLAVRVKSTSSYETGTDVAWTFEVSSSSGVVRTKQALDLTKGFLP
jgi:protein arginine N-methyltransferase 1